MILQKDSFTLYITKEWLFPFYLNKFLLVGKVQGYNIVIQGKDMAQLRERFAKVINGHKAICSLYGIEPFECLRE